MPPKPLPSLAEIAEVISYDPENGRFSNRVTRNNCAKAGQPTGCRNRHTGYVVIRYRGQLYLAHRLAWLFVHGADPGELDIDHINGDPSDNRATNLRAATRRQNLLNSKRPATNTSGHKGVSWKRGRKGNGRWCAYVKTESKLKVLGEFDEFSDAVAAYTEAAKKYHGEFARIE